MPHANVIFHDGSDPVRMHNTYAVIYNRIVFDLLKQRFGEGEAVVFARSATVGGQRFPVVSAQRIFLERMTDSPFYITALGRGLRVYI